MQFYCESIFEYKRLKTREVNVGGLLLGNYHPIRVQTMTTPDTMDTIATVEQSIRCIEAGSELIRITAPSKNEAANLQNIKDELRKRGYKTPIVADIHFTPNAAEIAARIVEKVRINPGNYVDKKKFEQIEYSDADYAEEIERIRDRFTPLLRICKEYGTAMRIGTNHGSLSDRIMSRYGDTPMGMVESAMEFLRIARNETYHNIVLSMKSSNPLVMVEAYRLLVKSMFDEFGECYPLHLGVTEAGDGEDGRIKSAIGIGTLLEDGLGDTIRVSLTEDPEFEIPVCKDIVRRYSSRISDNIPVNNSKSGSIKLPYDPFSYSRRQTFAVDNIGGKHVPVVIADLSKIKMISKNDLQSIGYSYDESGHAWSMADAAADYVYTADQIPDFDMPASLRVVLNAEAWKKNDLPDHYFPIFSAGEFLSFQMERQKEAKMKFVMCDEEEEGGDLFIRICKELKDYPDRCSSVVLCFSSTRENAMQSVRKMFIEIENHGIRNPVILITDSKLKTADEHLIHFATETGALLLDGFGDGICLGYSNASHSENVEVTGRTYLTINNIHQFTNNTAFSILQAARTRISKTDYISCPSCGRTLFDLQQITAKIREVTNHLKGVKIAVMGCIVNGPGEMADADFGYVGSGPGKITLYKGKEIVKRNVDSETAVGELIQLIKESGAWVSP